MAFNQAHCSQCEIIIFYFEENLKISTWEKDNYSSWDDKMAFSAGVKS